jgi:MFS family permease
MGAHVKVSGRDEAEAGGAEPRPSVGWVLASLALCMLLPSLGTSSANVALPTLAEAFGAPFQQVQWVVLAYLLATTTSIVSVGRLGDVTGHKRLLTAGIFLFTAASGLCGVASGLWLLIAARAAQGLGAAVMMALTVAFVAEAVPKARTGSAMGLLGSMSAVGTALGPSLGGVLIAGFGWPAIFFVNVPLGVSALLLAQRHLPADRRAPKADETRFDGRGTLLLALTLAAYALAMTIGHGRFGLVNVALLVAAALGVGLFGWAEGRAAAPLIRLASVRDPVLSASLATSALVSTVMMATLVVGPFYLARALGLDTAPVGIVMSVGPVIAALSGVPAGRIVDRFGAPRTTVGGLAGMAVGCSALCVAPATLGPAGYVIPIVVLTAHYALFQAANNTAVMTEVPAEERGVISGMLNLSRNLGLITGASAMGAVFALASRADDLTKAGPEAVTTGMRATAAVAAALVVVALVIALGRLVTGRSPRGNNDQRGLFGGIPGAGTSLGSGWETGIRTPIPWSRAMCPTVGRSPNERRTFILAKAPREFNPLRCGAPHL